MYLAWLGKDVASLQNSHDTPHVAFLYFSSVALGKHLSIALGSEGVHSGMESGEYL